MKIRALLACLALASCGSDSDFTPLTQTEQNIIGKWQLQSIARNGLPYTLEQCTEQNTLDFKNTGAFIQLDYGIPQGGGTCAIDSITTGSYTIQNDSIFFNINVLDTIKKAAVIEVTTDALKINSRMYFPDGQEGSDELIFKKITPVNP